MLISIAIAGLTACGGGGAESDQSAEVPQSMVKKEKVEVDPMNNPGVGPVAELVLPADIDAEMAAIGAEIYRLKCTACHKPTEKFIGPAPKGILERRNPAWIMNMILNPDQMVKEDPIAKKLLIEFNGSPMANQSLTEEEARAIVEYFRTL
jgi:mono/diheme cytochrome c family protein